MEHTAIIIIATGTNIITTVVGVSVLLGRAKENGIWMGRVDAKLKSLCGSLKETRDRLDHHIEYAARGRSG